MLPDTLRKCWIEYLKITTQLQVQFRQTSRRPFLQKGLHLEGIMLHLDEQVKAKFRTQILHLVRNANGKTLAQQLADFNNRLILSWPYCSSTDPETHEVTVLPLYELDVTHIVFAMLQNKHTSKTIKACKRAEYTTNAQMLLQDALNPEAHSQTIQQLLNFAQEYLTGISSSEIQRYEQLQEIQESLQLTSYTLQDTLYITVRGPRDITCPQLQHSIAEIVNAHIQRTRQVSVLGQKVLEADIEYTTTTASIGYARSDAPTPAQRTILHAQENTNFVPVELSFGVDFVDSIIDIYAASTSAQVTRLLQETFTTTLIGIVGNSATLSRIQQQWNTLLDGYALHYPGILSADIPEAITQIQVALNWIAQLPEFSINEQEQLKEALLSTAEQLVPSSSDFSANVQKTTTHLQQLEKTITNLELQISEIEDIINELQIELEPFGTDLQFAMMLPIVREHLSGLYQDQRSIFRILFPFTTAKHKRNLLLKYREEAYKKKIPSLPLTIYSSPENLEKFWNLLADKSKVRQQLLSLRQEKREIQRELNQVLEKYQLISEQLRQLRYQQERILKEDSYAHAYKLELHRQHFELSAQYLLSRIQQHRGEVNDSLTRILELLQSTTDTSEPVEAIWAKYAQHLPTTIPYFALMFPCICQSPDTPFSPLIAHARKPIFKQLLVCHTEQLSNLYGYQLLTYANRAVCFSNFKNLYATEKIKGSIDRAQSLANISKADFNAYYPEIVSFADLCFQNYKKLRRSQRVNLHTTTSHHQEILSFSNCFSKQITASLRPRLEYEVSARLQYFAFPFEETSQILQQLQHHLLGNTELLMKTQIILENNSRTQCFSAKKTLNILTLEECNTNTEQYTTFSIVLVEPTATLPLLLTHTQEATMYSLILSRSTDYMFILHARTNHEKTIWEELFLKEVKHRAEILPNLQAGFHNWKQLR